MYTSTSYWRTVGRLNGLKMFSCPRSKVHVDSAGVYKHRFAPWLAAGLTVHATGMLDEAAIKSGAALVAVPALAAFVHSNGLHGIVSDYEPIDE